MSHIFLQKDNITILGDIYDYPKYTLWENEKVLDTKQQKCLFLQIIITVNGKQKVFKINFDLELTWNKCSEWQELEEYYEIENWIAFDNLFNFIESIWYDISDFNIEQKIKEALINE